MFFLPTYFFYITSEIAKWFFRFSSPKNPLKKCRTMCNHKTLRLLKSNRDVGHYSNKNSPQKLIQKLHITIIAHLTY